MLLHASAHTHVLLYSWLVFSGQTAAAGALLSLITIHSQVHERSRRVYAGCLTRRTAMKAHDSAYSICRPPAVSHSMTEWYAGRGRCGCSGSKQPLAWLETSSGRRWMQFQPLTDAPDSLHTVLRLHLHQYSLSESSKPCPGQDCKGEPARHICSKLGQLYDVGCATRMSIDGPGVACGAAQVQGTVMISMG